MSDDSPPASQPVAGLDDHRVVRERYAKARRMREAGVELFVHRYHATHRAQQLHAEREALLASGEAVRIAGRVMIVRSFGKAGFFDLRDETDKIQVYVKQGQTDEAGYRYFAQWIDAGDIVGVEGPLFITRHGELTVRADRLTLLTKSMRPLPEKWHGLRDVELRYRQRYVDLIVNPAVRERFRLRSRLIAFLRRRLDELGYLEVETPMMHRICGGAAARPFRTHHQALDMPLYLRIAPELFLKRLLVGGFERVYEINRNFRNEGISTRHNPEFTMLELYTAGWDYTDTMRLTETLLHETAQHVLGRAELEWQGERLSLELPFRRVKLLDALAAALGLPDPHGLRWGLGSLDEVRALLASGDRHPHAVAEALRVATTPDEALMNAFEATVEASLRQPTFVMDYPKSLCPLAKSSAADPAVAERFELYIAGMEIANAYSELNDPEEQLRCFEEQVRRRQAGDADAMGEVDYDYVRALEYGMPPASGLGIGIDRLVMVMTDCASIRDVILFPLLRPE